MVDSQSTPARQRPSIVTISSYLLFLFLACQVVSLILTLATAGKTRDALREAYEGSTAEGADQVADVFYAIGLGSAVLLLLLAVVLGVLALFNNQGRNGARITTWIVGGIMVCCVGGSLLSGAAGSFTGGDTGGDMPSAEEIQRRLDEALPSWLTPVSILLGVISLLALLAALVLLALPKANEFFRKPTAGWEPPTPGASYPGYPQTPGQPGYPQAPGQPGYPSSGEPGYPSTPGQATGSGEPGYPPPPSTGPSGTDRPDDTPPADRPGTPPSTS
ncbi:hypothetical protein M8C17_15055 [Micromonospora sp. RHAY321]|uniref:hypothetical protein n=1 Tax=Micromonospora sp. RHAY321 TaxID=2944807 RepID=UPI00207C5913|nr:hypothetical protein [Micromonospora sp. RHAY321]MCO1596475.1 hypothetical protein [Micromonospora sp. RHAY321]